jgi:hypothetical protein
MGHRLGWYLVILEEIDREEHPPARIIRTRSPPHPPRGSFEQMQCSWVSKSHWRNPYGDCVDLDVIEEWEQRNSAVTG